MKKLRDVAKLVRRIKCRLEQLENYGFEKVKTNSASGRIWIHRAKRVVVKTPYLREYDAPKFAIPTLRLPFSAREQHDFNSGPWVFIQPLANLKKSALAKVRLIDMGYYGGDLKAANVGWYRGKPVAFDW